MTEIPELQNIFNMDDEFPDEIYKREEGNLIESLLDLAERNIRIKQLESDLKQMKSEFTKLEGQASRLMRQDEIEALTIKGLTFSQALPAFKIVDKPNAFKWLESEGFGSAIKQSEPTIHYQTLGALMRERMEIEGIESIPLELIQLVNTNRLKIK